MQLHSILKAALLVGFASPILAQNILNRCRDTQNEGLFLQADLQAIIEALRTGNVAGQSDPVFLTAAFDPNNNPDQIITFGTSFVEVQNEFAFLGNTVTFAEIIIGIETLRDLCCDGTSCVQADGGVNSVEGRVVTLRTRIA